MKGWSVMGCNEGANGYYPRSRGEKRKGREGKKDDIAFEKMTRFDFRQVGSSQDIFVLALHCGLDQTRVKT